jgi:hypothetical protein
MVLFNESLRVSKQVGELLKEGAFHGRAELVREPAYI